jgi:hypothetical protein
MNMIHRHIDTRILYSKVKRTVSRIIHRFVTCRRICTLIQNVQENMYLDTEVSFRSHNRRDTDTVKHFELTVV